MEKKKLIKTSFKVGEHQIAGLIYVNDKLAKKPSIILVHGLLSGFYMSPVGEYLAQDYNVYILDLPGFGDSSKPKEALKLDQQAEFLKQFIETLKLEKPVLVGNSYGCQVIVRFAVKFPKHTSKAVFIGLTVDKYARNYLSQTKAFFSDIKNQPVWQGPKAVATEYPKAGIKTLIKTIRDCMQDRPEDYLSQIKIPCLVVRGSIDPFSSRKWNEEITRLLPKGTFKEIAGKGHTVNSSAPQELALLVQTFLARN